MEVKFNGNTYKTILVNWLKGGDVFLYEGDYWIRGKEEGYTIQCCRIKDGFLKSLECDTEVLPVKGCKMVIGEQEEQE